MENKKSLVEEAIIQIKNLEDVVAENAKGILQSTMKEEINQLVKESLTEQDEEGDEIEDTDVELDDMESDVELDDMEDDETDNLEDDEMDSEFMDDEEEPVIDLTGEEDTDEVLRVFQLMGPDDEIIVQKDNSNNISLKDNKTNKEYMIVQESEEGFDYESEDELYEFEYEDEDEDDEFEFSSDDDNDDEDVKSIIDKVFSTNEQYEEDDEDIVDLGDDEEEMDEDDIVYEIEMDDEDEMEDEDEEEMEDEDE